MHWSTRFRGLADWPTFRGYRLWIVWGWKAGISNRTPWHSTQSCGKLLKKVGPGCPRGTLSRREPLVGEAPLGKRDLLSGRQRYYFSSLCGRSGQAALGGGICCPQFGTIDDGLDTPQHPRGFTVMTRTQQFFCTPIIAVLFLAPALSASEDSQRLWTIGIEDNNNAEFLLTPNHYGEYAEDGFFVVGQSETKRHWPYVHPGPDDAWAGGKSHTFGIAFGLKTAPQQGSCRLVFDLLDTQSAIPPKLRIDINGRTFEHATPRGGGDASVNGDPTKGREHKFEIAVPAGLLQDGNNFISITTLSGSWILYDWIGLETLPGIAMVQPSGTVVRRIRSSPLLVQREGTLQQTVSVDVLHFGDAREATIQVTNADPVHVKLKAGTLTIDVPVPTVDSPTKISVEVLFDTKTLAQESLTLQPVRKWVVYLLPHSHVDIGYTHVQTDVERSHWQYLRTSH